MSTLYLSIPVPSRDTADWGAGEPLEYFRQVAVEPDGSVLAYNDLDETYTRNFHSLSEEQVTKARALAAQVRAGTHYIAGGLVFRERPTGEPK